MTPRHAAGAPIAIAIASSAIDVIAIPTATPRANATGAFEKAGTGGGGGATCFIAGVESFGTMNTVGSSELGS